MFCEIFNLIMEYGHRLVLLIKIILILGININNKIQKMSVENLCKFISKHVCICGT